MIKTKDKRKVNKRNKNKYIIIIGILTMFLLVLFVTHKQNNLMDRDRIFNEYNIDYSKTRYFEIPEPYYLRSKERKQNINIDELKGLLSSIDDNYIEDTYDCSNRAAFVEWLLENNGIDAYILVDYKMKHTWVRIYIDNQPVDIETVPVIGIDNLPIRQNDYVIYSDIYDVFNTSSMIGSMQGNSKKYLDDWIWWNY